MTLVNSIPWLPVEIRSYSISYIITGKDISDQKPGSKFLSEGKIGYKEAHRLRNLDSNPRNHLRNKIKKLKSQGSLFPIDKMIVLTKEQKELLKFWKGSEYEIEI